IALQTRIEPAHRLSRNGTVTRAIEYQHRMAEQEQEHDNKPEQYHAPKWPVDGAGLWISFGGHCISYGGQWVMVADRTAWEYQRSRKDLSANSVALRRSQFNTTLRSSNCGPIQRHGKSRPSDVP
ncbi:MAG: hypothetical protein ACKN94_10240, partial [Pirellulaceae bacterium]